MAVQPNELQSDGMSACSKVHNALSLKAMTHLVPELLRHRYGTVNLVQTFISVAILILVVVTVPVVTACHFMDIIAHKVGACALCIMAYTADR